MERGVSYRQAIKRPFSELSKSFIGMLIAIVPILNFAMYGYAMEALRTSKGSMPSWAPFKRHFVEGFKAFVVLVLYFIPTGIAFVASNMVEDPTSWTIVSIFTSILSYYALFSGWINLAVKHSFGAAFEFRSVFLRAFTKDYFVTWIMAQLITLLIGIPLSLLVIPLAITIVGPYLVYAFTSFVLLIITVTIFGMFAYSERHKW